jgi:hypothetical protein
MFPVRCVADESDEMVILSKKPQRCEYVLADGEKEYFGDESIFIRIRGNK